MNCAPLAILLESNALVLEVTVWSLVSRLIQVTVVPTGTVIELGWIEELLISTVFGLVTAGAIELEVFAVVSVTGADCVTSGAVTVAGV